MLKNVILGKDSDLNLLDIKLFIESLEKDGQDLAKFRVVFKDGLKEMTIRKTKLTEGKWELFK